MPFIPETEHTVPWRDGDSFPSNGEEPFTDDNMIPPVDGGAAFDGDIYALDDPRVFLAMFKSEWQTETAMGDEIVNYLHEQENGPYYWAVGPQPPYDNWRLVDTHYAIGVEIFFALSGLNAWEETNATINSYLKRFQIKYDDMGRITTYMFWDLCYCERPPVQYVPRVGPVPLIPLGVLAGLIGIAVGGGVVSAAANGMNQEAARRKRRT